MNLLIFGATGMVGQGVLLECLRDPTVDEVVTLGRTATGLNDPKLREIVHRDPLDYSGMICGTLSDHVLRLDCAALPQTNEVPSW